MEAYVKSLAAYRTVKKAAVLSSSLTLDSLDSETSTVTVVGTAINRADAGSWLVVGGGVYLISVVKPQGDRTLLTLLPPLDAFDRKIEYSAPEEGVSVGGFFKSVLDDNWVAAADPAYRLPYLDVVNADTTVFTAPELDNTGFYQPNVYMRLMRKTNRTTVTFSDAGDTLSCVVARRPAVSRNIVFDDGHSSIGNVDYSSSGIAKLTAVQDIDTGQTDDTGDPILQRVRTTWYLAEDGTVSQTIPARRAEGKWDILTVSGKADVETKVREAFAKNKSSHKIEFYSDKDLAVQTDCTFTVYGELLQSYISYKSKSSTDSRYFYKSGELATTAAEKLRGLKN